MQPPMFVAVLGCREINQDGLIGDVVPLLGVDPKCFGPQLLMLYMLEDLLQMVSNIEMECETLLVQTTPRTFELSRRRRILAFQAYLNSCDEMVCRFQIQGYSCRDKVSMNMKYSKLPCFQICSLMWCSSINNQQSDANLKCLSLRNLQLGKCPNLSFSFIINAGKLLPESRKMTSNDFDKAQTINSLNKYDLPALALPIISTISPLETLCFISIFSDSFIFSDCHRATIASSSKSGQSARSCLVVSRVWIWLSCQWMRMGWREVDLERCSKLKQSPVIRSSTELSQIDCF